jgi:signal transduction histidine kinase
MNRHGRYWKHRYFPAERPTWWPPNEPWPPVDPARMRMWHKSRGRFFRRAAVFVALSFALAVAACTWLYSLVAALVNGGVGVRGTGSVIFPVVLILVGLYLAARTFRRYASPLGDLMDAASRVADGDYTVRVSEHGPREVRALVRTFNSMVARLQETDEQRRNLLADVTHELRTPLTVIQGNLEGLLDGVYPRDDAHLNSILDETRILSRLIDDLRTLALAESGALKLQKEPTDLGLLAAETVTSFKPQADAANVDLSVECDSELPVEVDPARIRQVLENLIANALRYTPQGGKIRVKCGTEKNGQGEACVVLSVCDTGAGIPAEDLPHIFDRFYKSRDSHGTGLGLAIAKNLVAAHGGEISVQSKAGEGTTIRFTLPKP